MSDIAVRVANRLRKRHAAKVYFADMYYEGTPVEKEIPDQLWDPGDPAKSFADIARYVDEQTSGQPTDSEFGDVTTFSNVIQHGSDHVGIGDYGAGAQGESPSVWVFGPTAAETIGKISKAIEAWNEETVPELADAGLEEIVQYALNGKTAQYRAAQPGDVKCPQCDRDRSPTENCWWCQSPPIEDTSRDWQIFYYMEHDDKQKEVQDYEEFHGTLKDAQDHADMVMVHKYRAGLGSGWNENEFSDVWNENHNYGDDEVYSRGYDEPDGEGYDFAVAYVGEKGWGQ